MSEHAIHVETDQRGVAALILSRPEKRNALSSAMITAMRDAVERLSADPTIRVIHLKGEGESFCAGADLGWMKDQFAAGPAERRKEAKALAHMLLAIDRSPKPVVAEAHGPVFGGGVGLLAVADIALAADDAQFGLPEVRLGILPATIGPYVAARIGAAATRRLFLSGARIDPAEAARIGLIAEAVPAATLSDRVGREIEAYLASAPGSLARAKDLARMLTGAVDEALIDATIDRLVDAWDTAEAQEGVGAFLERRKPDWTRFSTG